MQSLTLDTLQAAALFTAIIIAIAVLIGLVFLFASRANKYRDEVHKASLKELERDIKDQNEKLLKELRKLIGKENEKNTDS